MKDRIPPKAVAQCKECAWTKTGRGRAISEVKSKARQHAQQEGHKVLVDITNTIVVTGG
jgi:hypothetical protein